MADRIVVMGANPGYIRSVLTNNLPRPRDYRSPAFLRMVDRVHEVLTQTYLPDAPTPAATAPPTLEPLPQAVPSEILGLVETLAGYDGQMELFELAARARQEFGHVAQIVLAAEILDFVDTPRRQVVLTPLGRELVAADAPEQQRIFREQMKQIRLVQTVLQMLEKAGPVDRDDLLDHLALHLPNQNAEVLLSTLLQWGRFADLIGYDETTQQVSLS
ncbi:MAG TPA: AAA-associated domain-containing protein, partial [Gemmataceae bacterium]|nr:AAA-associated domain-containing protein [Gemmataceae bacterium]